MEFEFESEIVEWRGPAPFYFAPTPSDVTAEIDQFSGELSYGWGCIPAKVRIGKTEITTALIPKAGSYYVPLKKVIREPNQLEVGSRVKIRLSL